MESNRIEYKRELNESLEKVVVSFLNSKEGGVLYLGIDDKTHRALGITKLDDTQLKIKDRLKNNILPSILGLFDIVHEKKDGLDIIKINLASGPEKPYYIKKAGLSESGCYIRVGNSSEPMPSRMIEEYLRKRMTPSLAKIRSPRQDLRFEQLKIYYQESKLTLGDHFLTNLELLDEDGKFNYAAYLLADENGNSIQVAKYSGKDRVDLIESKEYGRVSLIKTCKMVLDKLELENRIQTQITGKERIDTPLWEIVPMREAIINAIVHNDYASELVPKFEIFSDRLEITSAVVVSSGKEQDEFFQGYSKPRNKVLMRVFKDLGIVEFLGSGLPRILQTYPREHFQFSANFLRISLPMSEKSSEKSSEKIRQLLKQNSGVTISELAEELGKTTRAVEKNLKTLQKEGKIKRVGPDKGGHWEVIDG